MTMRSLAAVTVALAVAAAPPSAAETKVILGAYPSPAPPVDSPAPPAADGSVGSDAPAPAVSVNSPALPPPGAGALATDARPGAKDALNAVADGPPDPGIGAGEAARVAAPPQSVWRRMWSAIIQFAPAGSR